VFYRILEIGGLDAVKVSVERGSVKVEKGKAVVSGNALTIMQISKDFWPL
jgi:hypothetical protein